MHTAGETRMAAGDKNRDSELDRIGNEAARSETVSRIKADLAADEIEEKFATLEKEDQVDRMLAEIKARRRSTA
jgi:hypothetical protein